MTRLLETLETLNETPGIEGSALSTIDVATGFVTTVGRGFWSLKQTRDHFDRFEEHVRDIRRRGLRIIIISDLREMATQTREVAAMIGERSARLYLPDDRVALVVPNSLVKMQMRRILQSNHEFFLSMPAAEKWALAHLPADAQASLVESHRLAG